MPTKMSILFQAGLTGWSETYYSSNEMSAGAAFLTSVAVSAVGARQQLSHRAVTVQAVRWADLADARKVLPIPFNSPCTYPAIPTEPFDFRDQSFTAIMIRFGMANGTARRIYLRGLPDYVTRTDTPTIIDPFWVTRFNDYKAYFTSGNWIGRNLLPADNPKRPILGWDVVAGQVFALADTSGSLQVGEKMIVSGAVTSPNMNRVWKVENPATGRIKLLGAVTPETSITWTPGTGYIQTRRYSNSDVETCAQVRITKHNAGVPFGLVRGRKRRRVRQVPQSLGV